MTPLVFHTAASGDRLHRGAEADCSKCCRAKAAPWPPERLSAACQLLREGHTIAKAAEALGATKTALRQALSRNKISLRTLRNDKYQGWGEDRVLQAVALLMTGMATGDVAKSMGVKADSLRRNLRSKGISPATLKRVRHLRSKIQEARRAEAEAMAQRADLEEDLAEAIASLPEGVLP